MAEMGEMEMPLPENTLPMMTGFGQFGPIEMGGMFTVVKVREGLAADDYRDPGWYKHPPGTVAYEIGQAPTAPPRRTGAGVASQAPAEGQSRETAQWPTTSTLKRRLMTMNHASTVIAAVAALRGCGLSRLPAHGHGARARDVLCRRAGRSEEAGAHRADHHAREPTARCCSFPTSSRSARASRSASCCATTARSTTSSCSATIEENLKHAEEMKKNPDMEHDDPNAKRLKPKKTGEIVWQFTKAGKFDFCCLIPGHREAGMSARSSSK